RGGASVAPTARCHERRSRRIVALPGRDRRRRPESRRRPRRIGRRTTDRRRTVLGDGGGAVRDVELGALALPTASGWRRADELVLPDAAILEVLDPDAVGDDAPFEVVADEAVRRWGREALVAVGVRDGFTVLDEGFDDGFDPDDPDSAEPPIPDLDLVADDAWPRAVRLL